MQVTLIKLGDNNCARQLWLDRCLIRIGRHLQLDVSLNEPGVSRFHCELGQINGMPFVRDLGSASGTFVNGFHIVRSDLLPGDRLTIGHVTFRVFYPRKRRAEYDDIEREMTLYRTTAARPQPSRLGLRPDPVGTESNLQTCAHRAPYQNFRTDGQDETSGLGHRQRSH